MALEKFLEDFNVKEETAPYEKVKDLIGNVSGGIPDLGESHRKHLWSRELMKSSHWT
jgi:hypothetical protein